MPAAEDTHDFLEGGADLAAGQWRYLSQLLERNAESALGRRYRFAEIRDPREYRHRVPLVEYGDLRPLVERAAGGERRVLTNERNLAFFKTSGSASKPKWIPVTPSLVREKTRAFGIFYHLLYRDHPRLDGGRWIANFADHAEREKTPGGRPVLSETSFWNERMQGFQARDRWPIPPVLREVADPELRFFAAARFALQSSLQAILSLNPSTLLIFARTLETWHEELVRGLAEGVLGWPGEVAPELAALFTPHLEARPERARELENLTPWHRPWHRAWPELELVVSWRSEPVAPYLRLLEPALEGIARRDYITQASEAIVAIPVRDGESGGLLAHTCHFFEFIPEVDGGEGDSRPGTLLAHELEEGRVYEVVVTTGGGLYRYRLGDLLRVGGFENGVPRLEFLGRRGATSSLTGEKLTERQVLAAAEAAARRGPAPERFVCFPRSRPLPHYGVLASPLPGDRDGAQMARWLAAFEDELARRNGEYADKRRSGRLGAPVALVAEAVEFDRLRRRLVELRGISEEQVKLGALTRELDLDDGLDVTSEVPVGRETSR